MSFIGRETRILEKEKRYKFSNLKGARPLQKAFHPTQYNLPPKPKTNPHALGVAVESMVDEIFGNSRRLADAVGKALLAAAQLPNSKEALAYSEAKLFKAREEALARSMGVRKIITVRGNGPDRSMYISPGVYGFASYNSVNDAYIVSEGFWEHFRSDGEQGAVIKHELNERKWLDENPGKTFENYHNYIKGQVSKIKNNKPNPKDWSAEEREIILEAGVIEKAEGLLKDAIRSIKFDLPFELQCSLEVIPGAKLAEQITLNEITNLLKPPKELDYCLEYLPREPQNG